MPRLRGWIIVIGLPLYIISLMVLCSFITLLLMEPRELPNATIEFLNSPVAVALEVIGEAEWWFYVGGPVILVAVTQLLFLLPTASQQLRIQTRRRSLLVSIAMAGFIAAILTAAMVLVLASFIGSIALGNEGMLAGGDGMYAGHSFWFSPLWVLIPLIVSWPCWSLLLYRFAQRRPAMLLPDRLIGVLLAGTVIELIVILPLDIMVRRRTDCYCATGSFHGLWLATGALLWLTGPGIVLALTSKRRRTWGTTHCFACGYAKGPSPGDTCPECGASWIDAA